MMNLPFSRSAAGFSILLCVTAATAMPLAQSEDAPPATGAAVETAPASTALSTEEKLLVEIQVLRDAIDEMRKALIDAQLIADRATRELKELRQFVLDHDRFGDDFSRYQAIKEIAEREDQRKRMEEARQRREAEREARLAKVEATRRQRDIKRAEDRREQRYAKAGFTSLGLDVYGGKMAFHYREKQDSGAMVEYDSLLGLYYRPTTRNSEIDFSRMNISGSVLNASDIVRNIGVAITFFDEHGNQVGSEIVQIDNARPDVPYPFNAQIDMALNRAFTSSSTYVLYADPVTGG